MKDKCEGKLVSSPAVLLKKTLSATTTNDVLYSDSRGVGRGDKGDMLQQQLHLGLRQRRCVAVFAIAFFPCLVTLCVCLCGNVFFYDQPTGVHVSD